MTLKSMVRPLPIRLSIQRLDRTGLRATIVNILYFISF